MPYKEQAGLMVLLTMQQSTLSSDAQPHGPL